MIIKLSSTITLAVIQDLELLIPGWSTARRSPMRGISFVKLNDRVLQEPVLDEDNNIVVPAQLAGETRYDVVVPDDYEIPELQTRVFPEISDHQIY